MKLKFENAKSKSELQKVYDYTTDAFSDSPDFNWNLDEIKKEIKDGWELTAAYNTKDEIVAAAFIRVDGNALLTKNTGLKINHQGSGYSHQIKEYFEKTAKQKKVKSIYHYCRIDNFRTYSLNESHGYKKTPKTSGDGLVVEWLKKI